jgi:hypothetical protein
MKMNREFLVLIAVILALAGYLVFRHTDRLHYRLPETGKVNAGEITRIEIVRSDGALNLDRKDGAWTIGQQGWQADPEKVKGMLSALEGFKVTDLVSESGSYDRYELDNAKKVQVRAFAGSRPELDLSVGKAASTGRHTYVMVPGDRKVYLAEGDLKSTFGVPASEIRNTLVLSFEPSEITAIRIEHEGAVISLTRQDTSAGKTGKQAAEATWKNDKGESVDKVRADTLLAVLSKVYCEGFLDDSLKPSLKNPLYAVKLKGRKEYTLSVYGQTEGKIPGLSSETSSPFAFPDYKLDGLEKAVQDVSGKQEEK